MERVEDLVGTTWRGDKRLWMDPDADPTRCEAELAVEDGVVRYRWSFKGEAKEGEVRWVREANGLHATFTDTWHQPEPMACAPVGGAALLAVQGSYPAPPGPDWGWRILLYVRPPFPGGKDEPELVLQMINIYPWGEEQRAVEIAGRRVE